MEALVPGHDPAKRIFDDVLAMHGAPAYIRRAQQVEAALEDVLRQCRKKRDEWLRMVRVHLGQLPLLAGDWNALRPLLADDAQVRLLQELHENLAPQPRYRPEPTSSRRKLAAALAELMESLEHFNRRWAKFLPTVELAKINQQRENYNRFYLLEKECSVRSALVARQGYRPLQPLTHADIEALVPMLPVPRLATR